MKQHADPSCSETAAGTARPDKREAHETARTARSRPRGKWRAVLDKCLSHFKNTRLLAKKTIRNIIFYSVTVLCLYPLLIFRHKILIVLYLFVWTNIAIAVATFLDELFDLPRKR